MRAHGVPDFPDPRVSVHNGGQAVSIRVVGHGAGFRRATQDCHGILPTPQDLAAQNAADAQRRRVALLAFAACLRAHGFSNFPDPTVDGRLSLTMIAQAGIDLHQPALLRAGDACVGVTHGQITKADVARAVNGPDTPSSSSASAAASGGG